MSLPELVFSISDVIHRIRDGNVTRIGVLNGAGISVNSGIPDFRSKGGLYDTLDVNNLPLCDEARTLIEEDASAIYSRKVFELAPQAVYATEKPFLLGLYNKEWKPSATHFCLKVLNDLGLLQRVYTTNIDGFETAALGDSSLVVQLHGTINEFCCHYCGVDVEKTIFMEQLSSDPTPGQCPSCQKQGIRPKVVFYGESLSQSNLDKFSQDCKEIDLLFVIGSSMTVAPVSELPSELNHQIHRVVLNRNAVGESVGFRYSRGRDVLLDKDCDLDMISVIHGIGKLSLLMQCTDSMSSISQGNITLFLESLKVTVPKTVPTDQHVGTRSELLVTTEDDFNRMIRHSREAVVEIPVVDVELTSYVTAGSNITIRSFIENHLSEVRTNMQMLMGGGTASGIQRFLSSLEALLTPEGLPWRLVIDDPNNEAVITKKDHDTELVYRTISYPLSAREKKLLGIVDYHEEDPL